MSEEIIIEVNNLSKILLILILLYFSLFLSLIQNKNDKLHESRLVRGLESRIQLLQIDITTLNEQLKINSLENIKLQREVVILRRDKIDLNEEIESLKKKVNDYKVNNEQYAPKIKELTQSLLVAETKLQSQVSLLH